jgi:hypothetical protein
MRVRASTTGAFSRSTRPPLEVRLTEICSADVRSGEVRPYDEAQRARQVVPISELVFGALTQKRNSLEDCTTTLGCQGRRRVSTLLGNLACILSPGHPPCEDR